MTEVPEWIATFVGRLALENEAMRRALAARPPAENGHHQVPEPAEETVS